MSDRTKFNKIREIIKAELEEADFEWDSSEGVMFCSDSNRGFDLDKITDEIDRLDQ